MNFQKMNTRIVLLISATIGMLLVAACGTRQEGSGSDVDTTQYKLATEEGPASDPARTLTPQEVDFGGKHYVVKVSIAPCDSLPTVKDSYGDPYLDNVVNIDVTVDGAPMVSRSFAKTDFASAATGLDLSKLVLGGMAYNKLDGSGVHFGAQLNSPGDEEGGFAFKVTIPLGGGSAVIERDNTAGDMSDLYVD